MSHLRARYDAAIQANRELYRDLQTERERTANLERRVRSLAAMLREAREARALWRHRATMLTRSAGAKVDFDTPPPRAGRNPPVEFAASKSTIAEPE